MNRGLGFGAVGVGSEQGTEPMRTEAAGVGGSRSAAGGEGPESWLGPLGGAGSDTNRGDAVGASLEEMTGSAVASVMRQECGCSAEAAEEGKIGNQFANKGCALESEMQLEIFLKGN